MNINEFISEINIFDLARDNLFEFVLTPPVSMKFSHFQANDRLRLFVKGVTFSPDSVTNNPRLGDGFKRVKIAQEISHQSDLEITFLIDADHTHYKMFNDWIQDIMLDGDTVRYLDEYTGRAQVHQYNRQGEKTTTYKFIDIYPISIGPKVYQSGTAGAPAEVTVNFSYRDMTIS